MFMSVGPHQAYGNIPRSIEYAVGWISECIEYLRNNNIKYIEAKEKGVSSAGSDILSFSLTKVGSRMDGSCPRAWRRTVE